MAGPRIALLGFSIECNRFAPPATRRDFAERTLLEGAAVLADARAPAPRQLPELPGFVEAMDAAGPWAPAPLLMAMAEPNGPVEQELFAWMMARQEAGLRAALPVDGVYCVLHGAGLATGDDDPEGTLLAMVRRVVGPGVPVVATFDLHANVSDAMVAHLDAFVGYRTNPHLDMRERGAEAAGLMRRLLGGERFAIARTRLPIVPPTVSMVTTPGIPNRPYGELIDLGQEMMTRAPWAGKLVNVSVMGGFAYADTPFNGLTAVVTATDRATAEAASHALAEAGWERRARFIAALTSLEEATARAGAERGLIFADVADNPGGGGRGNTMWITEAFHRAGVRDCLIGVIHDPELAAEAHALGEGAAFTARFNRARQSEFSHPFTAPAIVRRLHDGDILGRRGIFAGRLNEFGPSAALELNGLTVVVGSRRIQCADPAFFEAFDLDIAAARAVVVKSRGHFRGGFDEFFAPERIVEVDAPGLTSPVLSRFAWTRLPRPVLPLDPETHWPG